MSTYIPNDSTNLPVEYWLIPTWLDVYFKATNNSIAILGDKQKLNSILTADDILFYNQCLCKIYEAKHLCLLPNDVYPEYISPESVTYPGLTHQSKNSFENSISKKEVLAPFVKKPELLDGTAFLSTVIRYEILSLGQKHIIGMRIELCDPECATSEQATEDQKLAEFLIGEFGVKYFANTSLCKKILNS